MSGSPFLVYSERISARITPEARLRAERSARAHGMTLADWLREIIDVATIEPEPVRRPKRPRRPGS